MAVTRQALRLLGHVLRFLVDFVMGLGVRLVFRGNGSPLPVCDDPLLLLPAHTLAAKIRTKQFTSEAVVQAYISRIKQVNTILNAVVDQRFDAALAEARDVDRQIRTGYKTVEAMARDTPFLGVPVTIKENYQVIGMKQTVGLVCRRNHRADSDAEAVALIRAAGAIILGVTNVPELCSSWESNNKVYGRCNNPYNTTRISGGSSGGEGSIISAAGSVMGIGSDIGGSIRLPAMFCGIFGHKPTWGVVSNKGSEPVLNKALNQYLVTGPLCRYASDLRPLFKVLAGPTNESKLRLDEKVDMTKLRVYYLDEDIGEPIVNKIQPEVKSAIRKAVNHLAVTYGIRPQRLNMVQLHSAVWLFLCIYVEESNCTVKEKLKSETGNNMNLAYEILKWITGLSQHTIMPLAVATIETILRSHAHASYADVNQLREEIVDNFQKLLGDDGILICPTHPTTAVYHAETVPQFLNMIYTATFNLVGMPCTHCPLGLTQDGLPVGVQVVGARYQDRLTFSVAEALESGLGGWVCPGAKAVHNS